MKNIVVILISFFLIPNVFAGVTSPGDYFVTAGKLNIRAAPEKSGKFVKKVFRGQKVEVFEVQGEWARISPYFDDVNEVSGKAAHWAFTKFLRAEPYENSKKVKTNSSSGSTSNSSSSNSSSVAQSIKLSDDFTKYKNAFVSASAQLIKRGSCSLADFKKMGGWWRSLAHQPEPVYVTYCGGNEKNNRIYLKATTGVTFR